METVSVPFPAELVNSDEGCPLTVMFPPTVNCNLAVLIAPAMDVNPIHLNMSDEFGELMVRLFRMFIVQVPEEAWTPYCPWKTPPFTVRLFMEAEKTPEFKVLTL